MYVDLYIQRDQRELAMSTFFVFFCVGLHGKNKVSDELRLNRASAKAAMYIYIRELDAASHPFKNKFMNAPTAVAGNGPTCKLPRATPSWRCTCSSRRGWILTFQRVRANDEMMMK